MYDTMPVTQPDVVDRAAIRRPARRTGAVQESADRPRRHQFQRAADRPVERFDVDQGGHRQTAGQSDLRGRRRRRADVDRIQASSSRTIPELFTDAEAMYRFGSQSFGGGGELSGGSEGLRLRRVDDQRREVGPRADGLGHSRRQQAQRRQSGVAPHPDAEDARVR